MTLRENQRGFTIIELLIATAVFSTILLLCATGLITIARVYQKGNTSRATQEVARSIMDQIQNDFELNGGYYRALANDSNGNSGFCIGSNLYSYKIGKKTNLSDDVTGHGLVISQPPAGCDSNGAVKPEDMANTSARELLGQNMRLAKLTVTPVPDNATQPKLVAISLTVAAGDDDLLSAAGGCRSGAGQEYCASSSLESYATRRLQ